MLRESCSQHSEGLQCKDRHAQQDVLCHLSSNRLKQAYSSLQVHADVLGVVYRLLKSGLNGAVLLQLENEKE